MRRGGEKHLKPRYVIDTGPLLLYFAGNEQVRQLIRDAASGLNDSYTCDLNLAELHYKTCETFGREVADIRYTSLRNSGITVLSTDDRLTRSAAILKCAHRGKMSLADAYYLALAQRLRGTLVTTDHMLRDLGLVNTQLIKIS